MILLVRSSGRKNGKSNQLLNRIKSHVEDEVKEYDLSQMNIKGCSGCRACKKSIGYCVIADDLKPFFEDLNEAKHVIYASPNYMGEMSGQLKLLYDRHYSMTDLQGKSKINHLKSGVLLFTQGYENELYYKDIYSNYQSILSRQLNTPFALVIYGGDELLSDTISVQEKINGIVQILCD
ncbi:MAG: flavodoxin family protein [Clostridia bacterium]|nr:flavodoxin family protein [Clostridia bacterium]